MRSTKQKFLGVAWFLFVIFFVSGMITAAFFLTSYLYSTMDWHPAAWFAQVVNTLLGLLLTGITIGLIGKFARSKGWIPEMQVFAPIIDALERIARGDFRARVVNEFKDNQMVSQLAISVNKMALELNQMENMRQEFISNVSHEIQSPLTSIRGFAQALENDQLSIEDRHHYLHIIGEESTRLSRITEDLLQLASLESDRVKFEPKSYRLDKQLRSLILACEPQWMEKQLNVDISLEEVSITADEDLMSQVWMNLLHNSIKFTPQNGAVKVVLHGQGNQAECRISDTGIGISEADRTRIFERFYKADQSRTNSSGGSGLGLSIVKKIIEMHQGMIDVESRAGIGTTFIVSLPITH